MFEFAWLGGIELVSLKNCTPLRPSCKTGNIEGAIMGSELGDAADPSPYWQWDQFVYVKFSSQNLCVAIGFCTIPGLMLINMQITVFSNDLEKMLVSLNVVFFKI